jgi:outer membrane protein TolC
MIRIPATRVAVLAVALAALGPAPARALDLPAVLREVAAANPGLAARREMAEAARQRVGPAGAWPNPTIELGVLNAPLNGRLDMEPMTMKMVGVGQRVPLFGANRLSRRSARAAASADSAAAESARLEFLGMAWEAYADAFHAGELARAARAHGEVMDRLVQSARARYETARGRLDDVLRAEAERARTRVDVAAFEAEETAARARLDALRGMAPGTGAESLDPLPKIEVAADASGWTATVDTRQPRLRELEAQAARYRFSARAARRMALPELDLRASLGLREPLMGEIEQDDMVSASVGLMLPLFAPQRECAMAREMEAMARGADADRRAAELDLRREVLATHASAVAAARTVRLLADTVLVMQRRALEASWSAYAAGTTDLWRVLESSHALYGEEIALVRARQALDGAVARFVSLTGRGDLFGVALPSYPRGAR